MTDPTPTPTTTADGLRALADWIEAHPDLAVEFGKLDAVVYAEDTQEGLRKWALGFGNADKVYEGELFTLRRHFSEKVSLSALFWRKTVCKKVVVGVNRVPARLVPAQRIDAHDEEIVEWVCDDPILAVTT